MQELFGPKLNQYFKPLEQVGSISEAVNYEQESKSTRRKPDIF